MKLFENIAYLVGIVLLIFGIKDNVIWQGVIGIFIYNIPAFVEELKSSLSGEAKKVEGK